MEKRDSRFIEYDKRIQKKIEEKFNQALPAAVLVCWISAFAIYNSPIPIFFVYLNFISGVIFLVLQIYKNIISTEIKIYSSILVSYIMGVTSFLDGAFNSAGIILILIANTIAVLLFAKKKSGIFTYISIVTFLLLWIYTRSTVASAEQINSSYWIIKFVVFLLFLLIFNVIVFSIRKYLIKTIFDLE